MLIYKPRSVGATSIANVKNLFQLGFTLRKTHELSHADGGQFDGAVLVGKVALIEDFKAACEQREILQQVHIVDQRLAHVVDLPTFIFGLRIRQEEDVLGGNWTRGQIDKRGIWTAPNGVKFRFDEQPVVPDSPAEHALSAELHNLLFNDPEAIAFSVACYWLATYWERLDALHKVGAKAGNNG